MNDTLISCKVFAVFAEICTSIQDKKNCYMYFLV